MSAVREKPAPKENTMSNVQRWLVECVGAKPFAVYATGKQWPTLDPYQALWFASKIAADSYMKEVGSYQEPWQPVEHSFSTAATPSRAESAEPREQFEKWAKNHPRFQWNLELIEDGTEYRWYAAQDAWLAWQTAEAYAASETARLRAEHTRARLAEQKLACEYAAREQICNALGLEPDVCVGQIDAAIRILRKAEAERDDKISDGFGSVSSAWCSECGCKSMYVCRPGSIRCSHCYDGNPITKTEATIRDWRNAWQIADKGMDLLIDRALKAEKRILELERALAALPGEETK